MSPQTQEEARKQRMALMDEQMGKLEFLMKKIDRDIGYNFWKKYVASAFWSQISTPINLVITFLTAITTAQAQSPDLIPQTVFSQLAIVSLIITTLNTFFRPHTQFATNTEFLQKWNDIGIRFEKEYYDKIIIQSLSDDDIKTIKEKIKKYEQIQDDMNVLRKSEGTNTVNFLTDLLFLLCYSTCIRKYKRWLSHDQKIANEMDEETTKKHTNESKHVIAQERMNSELRVTMTELKREEEYALKRIHERYDELENKSRKEQLQQNVFDLFDEKRSPSEPASPPPPPPTQPPPPPTISIDQNVQIVQTAQDV
jgi:hypothetical protein